MLSVVLLHFHCAERKAALLFPDGIHYRGALDDENRRHGAGSMHTVDGHPIEFQDGMWVENVLQRPQILYR